MQVGELLARGKALSEIASALGIAKSTACYHKQRLGLPMKTECARRYDWEAIQRYYDLGHSKRKCQEKFGVKNHARERSPAIAAKSA